MTTQAAAPTLNGMPHAGREHSIRHVLVCLDRSAFAEACLPHAYAMVDAFGAKLTLVHVMASPEGDQPPARLDALDWEITRREAEGYLAGIQDQFSKRTQSGRPVAATVTQGRPAERIIALAKELNADLTVLGSHGERGVSAWNLGSTAQQVLALAPGSVLVVPPDPEARWKVPAKRVMVAVDGSLRSQSVLSEVEHLARFHGAEVLLVHVVPEPEPTAVLSDESDLVLARTLASRLEAKAGAYLLQLRERFFADVSRVETLVLRQGNERRALLDAAARQRVDLLVLAAHGASCDAMRPFGSVTAHILAHGRMPLLVLQDLPSGERDSCHPPASGEEPRTIARTVPGARPMEQA